MALTEAANRRIGGGSKGYSFVPATNGMRAQYAPPVRGGQSLDRTPNQPAPWTVGPNAGQGDARAPYSDTNRLIVRNPDGSPQINSGGVPAPTSPNVPSYITDPNGNYLSGDADAYVRGRIGNAPTVAPVDPTQANSIENRYLNQLAGLDVADNYTRQNYVEQEGLIGRNKTKSLGSLADSMADRGLSNSGIFLGATGDVNTSALEQLNSAAKSRDLLLNQNESGRVNAGRTRAEELAQAQADALANAIKAWTDNYNAQLEIARQRNAAVTGG
jgi:hypothetical protein